MIILANEKIKFENPNKIANKFVDIIAPTFGLSSGIKIAAKARVKLSKREDVRKCLTDVLQFLATEYKK